MTTTPAEDKSLWSAAKSLYAADRARHNRDGGGWPAWENAGRATRDQYRKIAERAVTPPETAEAAEEPREPLTVTCTVKVPLSSPAVAADALSRIPINANIAYEQGQGLISGLLGVGHLVATWTEER